jgi:hypothetical protein
MQHRAPGERLLADIEAGMVEALRRPVRTVSGAEETKAARDFLEEKRKILPRTPMFYVNGS